MQPFDYFARRLSPYTQPPRTGILGWFANLIYRACLFLSSSTTRIAELRMYYASVAAPAPSAETEIDPISDPTTTNAQRISPTTSRIRSNTAISPTSASQISGAHNTTEIHALLRTAIDTENTALIASICREGIPTERHTGPISLMETNNTEPLLAYIQQALNRQKYESLAALFAHNHHLANSTLPNSPQSALEWAIEHEDNRALEVILTAGASLRDSRFSTPLIAAIQKNNPAIVATLLNHRADPNECFFLNPTTPLQHAVVAGHPEIVRTLLQHGATDNAAFLQAVQEGKFEIARVWIDFAQENNTLESLLSSTNSNGESLLQLVEALEPSENLTGAAIVAFTQSLLAYDYLLPEAPLKDAKNYAAFVKRLSPAPTVHSHLNPRAQKKY